MVIDLLQIAAIAPHINNAETWASALSDAASRFDINNQKRLAAFLGQVCFESHQLSRLEEDLNYSAERLTVVWPREFPSLTEATPYAMNPQALANRVYANRDGNGPESTGDGWAYHGRGPIQLTGRANYRALGEALGEPIEACPELLLQPSYGALSAAWFWSSKGLNELADQGRFADITRRINGSLDGEADRETYWHRAQGALAQPIAA